MTRKPSRAPRLTDLQLVLLSAAAARPDLTVLPPSDSVRSGGAALKRVLASLLKRGLIEEVAAGREAEAWRETPESDRSA